MSKWNKFKEVMKNPPAHRLAKVEYQSYILQALGIIFVSGMLIYKGLWYVVFAFVFGLGINYSAGMTAYRKYKNIIEFMPQEKPKDYDNDISWTRRRDKIIIYIFGEKTRWICSVLSVLPIALIEFSTHTTWLFRSLFYPPLLFFIFTFFYFGLAYQIAYYVYKKEFKIK